MKAAAVRSLLACAAVIGATAGFAVASVAETPVAAAVSAAPLALALEAEPVPGEATRSPHEWDGLTQLVLEYLDQALGSEPTAASTTPTT